MGEAPREAVEKVLDLLCEVERLRHEVEQLEAVIDHHGWCRFGGMTIDRCARSVCDCGYEGIIPQRDRLAAEVARLTRECLDREATETDVRKRLAAAEAKISAVEKLAEDPYPTSHFDYDGCRAGWCIALTDVHAALASRLEV